MKLDIFLFIVNKKTNKHFFMRITQQKIWQLSFTYHTYTSNKLFGKLFHNCLRFCIDKNIEETCNYQVKEKKKRKEHSIWIIIKKLLIKPSILESLAGCRTMVVFAVFCKIGSLEGNAYWFHVKLIFIVIFGQSFKLDVRA